MKLPAFHSVSIFRGAAYGLAGPIWIAHLIQNGLSLWEIGLLGSLFELVKFILEVPTGAVTDRWGNRWSLALGSLMLSVTWWVFPFAATLGPAMLMMLIWASGEALLSGAFESWVASRVSSERVTKTVLRTTQFGTAALLLGALAGWGLAEASSNAVFLVAGACGSLQLGCVLLATIPQVSRGSLPLPESAGSVRSSFRQLLGWPMGRRILLTTAVAAMTFDGVARFSQPLLVEAGANDGLLSWVFVISAGIVLGFLSLGVWREQYLDRFPLRAVGLLDLIAVGLCALLVTLPSLWMGVVTVAVLLALEDVRTPILSSAVLKETPPHRRATMVSLVSGVGAAAEILAGVLFGALAAWWGTSLVFVVAAVALLISVFAAWLPVSEEAPSRVASAVNTP